MRRVIAHCHQQQDRTCSNQRLGTLCVFNMCLLFGDNQTWLGGGLRDPKSGNLETQAEENKSCQAGGEE